MFAPHTGRRVVLSTNVAETSLTVPGIRYVIDPGTARISRYSMRTKVQRLPIEPISQASARQRAGRCGRVADGICIRLYSEEDFESRPAFTEPEILRTNLASVILQMTALGLGDIERVPVRRAAGPAQPSATASRCSRNSARSTGQPQTRARADAHPDRARTRADCRSIRGWHGCSSRHTATAASPRCWSSSSALSIQDVRERPAEHQQAADEQARPVHRGRLGFPRLPAAVGVPRASSGTSCPPTSSGKMCRGRVPALAADPGMAGPARPAAHDHPRARLDPQRSPRERDSSVHQALLAGLLSHIGVLDEREKDPAPDSAMPRIPRRPRHPVRDLPRVVAGSRSRRAG